MTIIAPSLLSADFLNLKSELERFENIENLWLHLDIMDGHFVPNLTFGPTVLRNISKVSKHKLDAHLMVLNPEQYIKPLKDINVHNFTFHWEAVDHHDRLISVLKENFASVGISVNPSTNIATIPNFILKKIDLVLVMTVNPGFGGQSFIEGCIDKVNYLNEFKKKHNLNFQIQVDGGVNDKNAKRLIAKGATNLVAGSFVFKAKNHNYKENINKLRQ